ncbi:MAG: hypothetical protein V1774_05375 [Candidatus Eisenbacteria bacterium]
MTANSPDPRREMLVAALYGELPAAEEQVFRAMLAEDEQLRADWEELSEARSFLQSEKAEEQAPAFVFLRPPEARSHPAAIATSGRRRRGGWAMLRMPTLGFAFEAAALLVLMLAGLRVDRQEGALVMRFGSAPQTPGSEPPSRILAGGIPLEPNGESSGQTGGAAAIERQAELPFEGATNQGVFGAADADPSVSPYLTRAEFAAYSNQLVQLMSTGLSSYERRRQEELRYLLTGIYSDLENRQERTWNAMNTQFAEAWLRLAAAGGPTGTRLEVPYSREDLAPSTPGGQTAPEETSPDGD